MKIINGLIEQYKSATGVSNIDINSQQFLSDFDEWLRCRNKVNSLYIQLLDYMKLEYRESWCAEVGKSSLDSIVIPFETTIITPYSSGFEKLKNRTIISDLKIYDSIPTLIKDKKFIKNLYNEDFSTYMTQNPYTDECIKNWDELYNFSKIIVGVFGHIYEKDVDSKIKQLKEFKSKLDDNYKEDYNTFNDSYCYVIAKDKVKVKYKKF